MLFTGVTSATGAFSNSSSGSSSTFNLVLCSFNSVCFCRFRKHDSRQTSVSKPHETVSSLCIISNQLAIQTLFRFLQVRSDDKFLVRVTTRHLKLMGLTFQRFQKQKRKFGTENCLTRITRNLCKIVLT